MTRIPGQKWPAFRVAGSLTHFWVSITRNLCQNDPLKRVNLAENPSQNPSFYKHFPGKPDPFSHPGTRNPVQIWPGLVKSLAPIKTIRWVRWPWLQINVKASSADGVTKNMHILIEVSPLHPRLWTWQESIIHSNTCVTSVTIGCKALICPIVMSKPFTLSNYIK